MSRPSIRIARGCGPMGFAIILACYLGLHAALRLLVSPTLNIDDAREAVLGQSLEWGYQARQPPLYDWLVWLAFRLFGVSLATLTLLKYAVLAIAYAGMYGAGRRMFGDARLAALAAFSLVLLLPLGWSVHEDLTHSVAALAACAGTLYVVALLETRGDRRTYLAFGTILGLGVLSKYTYVAFVVVLVLAGLTLPGLRRRFLHVRMGLALLTAGVIAAPFLAWLTVRRGELAAMYVAQIGAGPGEPYVRAAASGLYHVARAGLFYGVPLTAVVAAAFWGAIRMRPARAMETPEAGRLLGRFLLAALVLLAGAALGGGLAHLKFRWLIPAFFPLPLYAFWRIAQAQVEGRRLRRYAALLLVAEVLLVCGFALRVRFGGLIGYPSELSLRYGVVARQLASAGFHGGTALVGPGRLAGNLRPWFPGARVISLESPAYVPPPTAAAPCLVIWEMGSAESAPPALQALLGPALDDVLAGATAVRTVDVPYRHAPGRVLPVHYILLPEGTGRCR